MVQKESGAERVRWVNFKMNTVKFCITNRYNLLHKPHTGHWHNHGSSAAALWHRILRKLAADGRWRSLRNPCYWRTEDFCILWLMSLLVDDFKPLPMLHKALWQLDLFSKLLHPMISGISSDILTTAGWWRMSLRDKMECAPQMHPALTT